MIAANWCRGRSFQPESLQANLHSEFDRSLPERSRTLPRARRFETRLRQFPWDSRAEVREQSHGGIAISKQAWEEKNRLA